VGDLTGQIKDQRGGFGKLLSKLPGFKGYMEKETRRDADKLIRDVLAQRFGDQLARLNDVQNELLANGGFEFVDDVEGAAVKLRTFIDRVKTAPRGYAGLFDAVQVKEDQLDQLYNFDYQLLAEVDTLSAAIDKVRMALGTLPAPAPAEGQAPAATGAEALKPALSALRQSCAGLNDLYDKREHILLGSI
jgi:RecB family exonuclease